MSILPSLSTIVVGLALAGVFVHLLFDAGHWRGADQLPLEDLTETQEGRHA